MDPITFAQTLLRRWWLMVALSIAGVGCAYFLAANAPTRYQSMVSLQLNPAGASSFLPYLAATSVSPSSPVTAQAASYLEVLRSRAFGQVIVQQLNLPVAPETFAGAISTQLVPNTNILRLTVTWDNPSDAQQLAQRIAELFIAENQRRQQSQPGTQARLADLEQSARDIKARVGPLQQQRDRLDDAVARGDLGRLNELTGLDGRLTALDTSYANLIVEISRVRSSFDTAVILDNATPGQPIDALPLFQAWVFGGLGGLGFAVGLILLHEHLADVVRTPRDVMTVVSLPVLGRVPNARIFGWRKTRWSSGLVMLSERPAPAAEAFRSLRVALQLTTPGRSLGRLMVTSGGSRDGKTFVAANLAIALAQAGKEVLLVDANLRHPAVHGWFGVPNTIGFADALVQARSGTPDQRTEVAGVIASGLDNLWLLPAGASPPNPSELLGSEALDSVMERLGRLWDTVIIDTEHIGLVADTLLLAHQASSCVLVARSGKTRRATFRGALAALDVIGHPVIGAVLNDERPGPLARFAGGDDHHYGYLNEDRLDEVDNEVHGRHNGRGAARATSAVDSGDPAPQERKD